MSRDRPLQTRSVGHCHFNDRTFYLACQCHVVNHYSLHFKLIEIIQKNQLGNKKEFNGYQKDYFMLPLWFYPCHMEENRDKMNPMVDDFEIFSS